LKEKTIGVILDGSNFAKLIFYNKIFLSDVNVVIEFVFKYFNVRVKLVSFEVGVIILWELWKRRWKEDGTQILLG
jgi:hypothetical protein